MLSYIIVGSGYRAAYFARVARTYPTLFRAMFLCRSQEKAAKMTAETGAPATTSVDDCLRFSPDFAVIAVDRGHVAQVAEEWIERGFPVVTETPVGETFTQLERIWALGQRGAKIVCCEQYHRQPTLMAGLTAVKEGIIGAPSSMYLSLVHDYHAASLIRRALLLPVGEAFTLVGMPQESTIVETDSRASAIWDNRTSSFRRDAAMISFACGKQAIYDFCPVQYRTFIRARHLLVRGEKGEWSDTAIHYADEKGCPQKRFLTADIPEKYRPLDTQALRDRRRVYVSDLAPDTVQDEFAIASILWDMEAYLQGAPSPYPLEEALEDACFWLRLREAMEHPFETIRSEKMPWHG